MSNEQFNNIRNFFIEEYKREIQHNNNIDAVGIVYQTTIAYISGRYPKMQAKTIYEILSGIRKEVWGI